MAKAPMHRKLYKDSPEMERDNESGNMAVKKPSEKAEKESERTTDGTASMPIHEEHAGERMEMRHRHIKEHVDMHTKHAMEHMHHKGEKHGLHEKHEKQHAEMHDRHHKEMKKLHEAHEKDHGTEGSGAGKEKISKVEKGE